MSRYCNGWVKIHRKIIDSDFKGDPYLQSIWIGLLTRANWRDGEQKVQLANEQVCLKRGELVTSMDELKEWAGCCKETVRKKLCYLENTQRISKKSSRQGTIITILNYCQYQDLENDQQTHCRHTVDTPWSPIKKIRSKELLQESEVAVPFLISLWNEQGHSSFAKVNTKTLKKGSRRYVAAEARFREMPDPAYWQGILKRINESAFCLGQGERGWKATIDFFLRQETHCKAMEGQYDNRSPQAAASPPRPKRPGDIECRICMDSGFTVEYNSGGSRDLYKCHACKAGSRLIGNFLERPKEGLRIV